MSEGEILDGGHWRAEEFLQRVTAKQWREILLSGQDQVIYHGKIRKLVAKHLGLGVYEITKEKEVENGKV